MTTVGSSTPYSASAFFLATGLVMVGCAASMNAPARSTRPRAHGDAAIHGECAPSPCETSDATFDSAKCTALADWIAVGVLSDVVRQVPQGPQAPIDVTFTVRTVEKGDIHIGQTMQFRIGACRLLGDTSGSFRFYGKRTPHQYLHFTAIDSPSTVSRSRHGPKEHAVIDSPWTVSRMSHGPKELVVSVFNPLCGFAGGYAVAGFAAWFTDAQPRWWESKPIAFGVIAPMGGIAGLTVGTVLTPLGLLDGTWDLVSLGATSKRPYLFFGTGGGSNGKGTSIVYSCAGFLR